MATSPIYNWPEPDNTDLVKNGALAIRTMGNAIDTTMGTMTSKSTYTAKGSIAVATAASTPSNLAVGANGEILVADSSTASGLKYAKSGNFIGCRATKTGTNQTTLNNTYTLVTFNAETYDTDGFHSTITNTERMTIPAGLAGYYQVTANVGFDTNTTGRRQLQIRKNGSAIAVGETSSGTSTNYPAFNTSLIVNLAVGDYVDFEAYQTSGGNLDVLVQAERTSLQIQRVGS